MGALKKIHFKFIWTKTNVNGSSGDNSVARPQVHLINDTPPLLLKRPQANRVTFVARLLERNGTFLGCTARSANNVVDSSSDESGAEGSRRRLAVVTKVGEENTSDTRSSHRGTGGGVVRGLRLDPSRGNVDTEEPDIEGFTKIGEVPLDLTPINCPHSVGTSNTSRGVTRSVHVIITGGDGEVNTTACTAIDCVIDRRTRGTAKGEVDNGGLA